MAWATISICISVTLLNAKNQKNLRSREAVYSNSNMQMYRWEGYYANRTMALGPFVEIRIFTFAHKSLDARSAIFLLHLQMNRWQCMANGCTSTASNEVTVLCIACVPNMYAHMCWNPNIDPFDT